MIVWSGRGFYPIVVLFVIFILWIIIFPEHEADVGFIIACFFAGIFSWYFGKKWNTEKVKAVIDVNTGERLLIQNNHSLFWIPLQYWGVPFSVFGIGILFQNSILYGMICSIILLSIILWTYFNKRSEPKKWKS